ncbi:hypothetical protein TSH7_25120 [Azospirillum sp. TSH7]|uniref:hypothetical protein n=1 Tax=unclassified Azospirillum TaxID=2630922 RepID=UPI000D61E24D|nr:MULTISPECIES: hypothetical protein [unclassified Azospirillum]PWC57828.1 hypothetical protein TSH7_25120 [Azospirillum sp. TSH7]PWC70247.1 hypothetical protein TSH20_07160 [Azospirillum sp. TSH20]
MAKQKHQCPNRYAGDGDNGGCYFEIDYIREGIAYLDVGHSCAIVHRKEIPVTWLAELVSIATAHKGGIAGFLLDHSGGDAKNSYALMCDPPSAA